MKLPLQHRIAKLLLLGGTVFFAVSAGAQMTYTLTTTDRGWYNSAGDHDPDNDNYSVGRYDEDQYRNFFAFDRSSVQGTVLSAELRLFLPSGGYLSSDSSENLFIYKISNTSVAALTAGGDGLTSIYADLGDGSSFGSATIGNSAENSFISILLNNTFLSYLNGLSGEFAVGGRLSTLGGSYDQILFGYSDTGDPADGNTQLIVRTDFQGPPAAAVPEPSTYGVLGAIVLLAVVGARRAKTRR